MTDQGTFIINGAERVVVSQLVRSPGLYYSSLETRRRRTLYSARSPEPRPADRSRRATRPPLGQGRPEAQDRRATSCRRRYETNDEIGASRDRGQRSRAPVRRLDAGQDLTKTQQDALIESIKKLRPGDPPTGDNARQLVEASS